MNMGALANPRRATAMEANVEDASKHGGKVRTGGHRIGDNGNFCEPTVVTELPNDAKAMNEEPFGPLAVINPFKTFDDAVDRGEPAAVRPGRLRVDQVGEDGARRSPRTSRPG